MGLPVRNKKGFSLIEMMIAMVFIEISMLALLTTLTLTMQINVENEVRNTAIRIANQTAETLMTLSMNPRDADLTDGAHVRAVGTDQDTKGFPPVEQSIRKYRQTYNVGWTVVTKSDKVIQVTITVGYSYKNKSLSHSSVMFRHFSI